MRASNCVTDSVSSPLRISRSQAARINACSDRKPRSFDAFRTRSRNSLFGNNRLRSILGFAIYFLQFRLWKCQKRRTNCSGTFVPHCQQKSPHSFLLKTKHLPVKTRAASPQPFMFQYVCRSPIIRLHCMHATPTAIEECRLLPTLGDFLSTSALFSRLLPTSSRLLPTVVYVCRVLPTSVYLCRPRACSCFTSVQGGAICTAA